MKIITEWKGLEIQAEVNRGEMGDSAIPGGMTTMWDIDQLRIYSGENDLCDYLTSSAIDEIEALVIEEAENEHQ